MNGTLFDCDVHGGYQVPRYPDVPGAKTDGPSEQAGKDMENRSATLRQAVLIMLKRHNGLTADEVADLLGESVLAIRPRLSELRKAEKIEDTGLRRANVSGKSASVWRVA